MTFVSAGSVAKSVVESRLVHTIDAAALREDLKLTRKSHGDGAAQALCMNGSER